MADEQAQPNKQLMLQKIYVKDLSFESPKAPDVFRQNPPAQTQLNIRTGTKEVDEQHIEVTLTLTVESKDGDETLFLVELAQAGVFLLEGYTPEERSMIIGSFCPATLYPYAREAISDISVRGGFPQLLLQPINFDAVFAQAQQQRAAEAQQQTVTVSPMETQQSSAESGAAQPGENAAAETPSTPQGNGGTH